MTAMLRWLAWISVLASGCERADPCARDIPPGTSALSIHCPLDFGTYSPCNLGTSGGCETGQACTWIVDQDDPFVAHPACVTPGTTPVGSACTQSPAPLGTSDCELGSFCSGGECRRYCDDLSSYRHCDNFFEHCVSYGVGSLCHTRCDPLTQQTARNEAACGSPDPTAPALGCFGGFEFSCQRAYPDAGAEASNTCQPGFLRMQTPTGPRCVATCAPLEIDNAENIANALGDATAYGFVVGDRAPVVGHATCDAKVATPSECRFLYPIESITVPTSVRSLGACVSLDDRYDVDGDGIRETTIPSCTTLPKRSANTPGRYDDAADWGCQRLPTNTPAVETYQLRHEATLTLP
jgi:hypothetical protein